MTPTLILMYALFPFTMGRLFFEGLSCAFQIPDKIMKFVLQGQDLTQASNSAGITSKADLGEREGLIGILSNGRITRQAYTEQGVRTALFGILNKDWYKAQISSYHKIVENIENDRTVTIDH